jgi:hypothetical protein
LKEENKTWEFYDYYGINIVIQSFWIFVIHFVFKLWECYAWHYWKFSAYNVSFWNHKPLARHDLRCAIASCVVRVPTNFVETCDVHLQLQTFFSNNARYKDENAISFGVYYNFVAQKLSLLAI